MFEHVVCIFCYFNNHYNISIYKLDDVTVLIFGSLNYDIDHHFIE
jgi:hypothetical protein